jgi:hypothetical protein
MRATDRATLRALTRRFLTDTVFTLARSVTITDFGNLQETFTRTGSFRGLLVINRSINAVRQQTKGTDAGEAVTGTVRILCEEAPSNVEWVEVNGEIYRVLAVIALPYRVFEELQCKPRREVV